MENAGEYMQTGTGIVGEYLFYKRQAEAEGKQPIDFNSYQTMDANRKAKATAAAAGEMTAQQAVMFNGIVAKFNSSPLMAAKDRTIVLKNAIAEINKDPNNGAKQLSLVYAYVQALDTYQSAVREGELSLVNSIDSKTGQLTNYVQKIQQGQIVRADVAKNIAAAAKSIVDTIEAGAKQKEKQYASQANVVGLSGPWNAYIQGFSNQTIPTEDDYADKITDWIISSPQNKSLYDQVIEILPDATPSEIAEELGIPFNNEGSGSNNAIVKGYNTFNTSAFMKPYETIKLGSPLAIKNNNPGNLRFVGQEGATQGSGGFAKFSTPEAGMNALKNQIAIDTKNGHTLKSFINKYAPSSENNTSEYLSQAMKALGVSANMKLSNIDATKLLKFMAMKESSSSIS